MKNFLVVFTIVLISTSCTTKLPDEQEQKAPDSEAVRASVNNFIDQWHRDAANADLAYFEKMAPRGTYLGTDPTENWSTQEFRNWAGKYFDEGEAWDFTPRERNVYLAEDGKYIWFDELLDTWMGVCRGSGVLSAKEEGWQLEHYHLSMTIPNDLTIKVIEIVEHEQKMAEKQQDTL
jgi:hypothetical protein